jgi:uncharacterized protein
MALDDPIAVYSTRPTVEVGGMDYPQIHQNIVAIRVQEDLGGLSTAELTVIDWVARGDGSAGFAGDGGSPLKLGAGLRLFLGPAEVLASEIFDGQIIAVEADISPAGPPRLTVIAEDRLFAARRTRKSRIFEQKSPADVVRDIAEDYGLTAEIRSGLDIPVCNWVQQDESDLAFLRRILTRFDADVQMVGARMQVGRIAIDQRAALTLTAGITLESVRICADAGQAISTAKLTSFDPGIGETVSAEGDAVGYGPGQGRTGADFLSQSFASIAHPLGHFGPMTQAEADALVAAECARRARAFVQASGTAVGNALLRVGSWITLAGVNPAFANVYAVRSATHRYDVQHGYKTDFMAECAYFGEVA